MADTEYTRLHISPLNPSLLNTYLPASVLPSARNISYHNLQTFPERAYGYIELPTMDAEKIKKKLNGAILKGTKVKIETARPEEERSFAEEGDKEKKQAKKEKGKKRKRDEIPAVDIGERSVKRGWTVPAAMAGKDKGEKEKKGKVEKSKFTGAPECLFKTVLPPNVTSKGPVAAKESKSRSERAKGKEMVIHEFSKTTKYATFLRSSLGSAKKKTVAEFVKGKGWVDEDGNVVEAVKERAGVEQEKAQEEMNVEGESFSDKEQPMRAEKLAQTVKVDAKVTQEAEAESSNSSSAEDSSDEEAEESTPTLPQNDEETSDSSSSESSSDEGEDAKPDAKTKSTIKSSEQAPSALASDSDSSTDTSSSSDSESDSDSDSVPTPTKPATASRPQSSSGPPAGLCIKIPANPLTTSTTVHPLEALYKRAKPDVTSTPAVKPAAPSFSFFGADGDNEDIDMDAEQEEPQVPLTPFTQRDFEWRGTRSAAPTPDTAFANKRFVWPGEDEDDDEDEQESTPLKGGKGKGKSRGVDTSKEKEEKTVEETEFQRWFYEHRGEANRAWKKRRKVVAKEKRQRENRKRQDRV